MLGQLQDAGNTTTMSHYLNLLNTAGLLGGLEKFSLQPVRKRSSSPKFQLHNTALLSAQKSTLFKTILTDPAGWGRIVESSIGAYLLNQSICSGFTLYYYRERNEEVDFVMQKDDKIIALEVKSNYSANFKGLETFKQKFCPVKTYLVDNKNLSWSEVLKIDPLDLF